VLTVINHKILGLAIMLLINGCDNVNNGVEVSGEAEFREIVVFCGNPGVGKSSLCNSIFQLPRFTSGISIGHGLTTGKQEYICDGRKYMDTPGLSDIDLRRQAGAAIEQALKENNNYKIIFVATLEAGRIKPDDLVTINTVCDAINAPFNYGIIFNKVTKAVMRELEKSGEITAQAYLPALHKAPASCLIIQKSEDMEDEAGMYLAAASEDRKKLINFIDKLQANVIIANQVTNVEVDTYEEKVEKMERYVAQIREDAARQISQAQSSSSSSSNKRKSGSCTLL
jgi:predicted GTPase